MHCDGAMCCDCEVMDFDDEDMSFMTGPQHSILKFMNTVEATNRGPHHGHNGKYMEVEGSCHVFLDHCSHVS